MATDRPFLTDISLICLVTADIDAAVRQCQDRLGIGPWEIYDFVPPLQHDTKLRGVAEPYTMRVAFGAVGNVGWSFLQPLAGRSIYAEFLARNGNRMHHTAFLHPGHSYPDAIAEFERRGFPLVQQGNYCGRYCYFDTRERTHMIFELIEDHNAIMQGLIYRYPERDAPPFDATRAIGLVTEDLESALAAYRAIGIDGWSVSERDARSHVRRARVQVGRSAIELVQPERGPSIYREFLDRRGPGVHHLELGIRNGGYDACKASFAARGITVVGESTESGRRACYLETEPILGVRLRITD